MLHWMSSPFDQIKQFAGEERPGLGGLRRVEERRGGAGFHDTAAMEHDDVAGEPARLAEIVGRHHDLDAALR